MSVYFNHEYASNSDLKRLMSHIEGDVEPENLDEIFKLGTLIHQIILEPHKADRTHKDYALAVTMGKTFMKDDMCRKIIMMPDFRREHEFYKEDVLGIKGRAKMDGSSKMISTILEYKGLGVTSEKAFEESIMRFHYDQGAAWYLNCSDYRFHRYRYCLLVGVSKKEPDRLFKRLIDRDHKFYNSGMVKAEQGVGLWKNMLL